MWIWDWLNALVGPTWRWVVVIGFVTLFAAEAFWANRKRAKTPIRVSGLFIYPLKSCGGISVKSLQTDWLGFPLDRRWMVVDSATNNFLTIRQHPRMCLIQPHFEWDDPKIAAAARACVVGSAESADAIRRGLTPQQHVPFNAAEPDVLVLTAPGVAPLRIPLTDGRTARAQGNAERSADERARWHAGAGERVVCTVWRQPVVCETVLLRHAATAAERDHGVSEWLSAFLQLPTARGAKLVQLLNHGKKPDRSAAADAKANAKASAKVEELPATDAEAKQQMAERATEHSRPIGAKFNVNGNQSDVQVAFADGFPFLLASDASLADLNTRLLCNNPNTNSTGVPRKGGPLVVPMRAFRPNITVGAANRWSLVPFEEDLWHTVRLGTELLCRAVKPCSRCGIPTVDPATAQRSEENEPTATLRAYRQVNGDVYFAQNLIHATAEMAARQYVATVCVADTVTVEARKTDFFEGRVPITPADTNVQLPDVRS